MKRMVLAPLLMLTLTLWAAPLLAQTEDIFIHFAGNGLEEGGFDWSDPGDELNIIAIVTNIEFPPELSIPYNPDYEYTLVVTGLISNGEIVESGASTIVYNMGAFALYEDTSPDASWDEAPAVGTPPASFTDGTLWLSGPFTDFIMWIVRDWAIGNFEGHIDLNGGSAFPSFPSTEAYTFGGALWPPHSPTIPPGYDVSIDGEAWVIPTAETTWTKVKGLY